MDRPGHELATFFIGTEVEHTPAYGKKTLFVVGIQDYHRILEIILDSKSHPEPIEHVYFGANMSFPNLAVNNGEKWGKWEKMIFSVMEQADIMCTLDVDVSCVEGLAESGLCENHNFIPMRNYWDTMLLSNWMIKILEQPILVYGVIVCINCNQGAHLQTGPSTPKTK